MQHRPHRLGLRARITLAFALGSLLISVALSASTWAFTRESQLNLRSSDQVDSLTRNAPQVRTALSSGSPPEDEAMNAFLVQLPTAAATTVVREDVSSSSEPQTTQSNQRFSYEDIPMSLRVTVTEGQAASMQYRVDDTPLLAMGIPLPSVDAAYFEITSMAELEQSLDLLAAYLTGATILVTIAGGLLGWWASRRTLLPLADVGTAAHAIASGRLDTRLEAANDPDLTILVASFNDMAATLQARIERDARFASDVSHELRSPLMTLAASVEVLETRRDELPERSQAALDLLVDDVDRFQQLVSDLLEISRFDAGAAHLQLEPVLLPEFLARAVAEATPIPVPVITGADSDDLIVTIDKRRMAQVIANLIDNAAKYGGSASAVRITRLDGDRVEISVEDRGPGVDPEDRERIFDRFSRGVSTAGTRGADSGSGLGLALVAEHVALHDGAVSVQDRLDGEPGARFVVDIPIGELPEDHLDDLADVGPYEDGAP